MAAENRPIQKMRSATVETNSPHDLDSWVEGVTPTWATCEHGVMVAKGTYLRDLKPTGDHPECWTAILQEMAEAADQEHDHPSSL